MVFEVVGIDLAGPLYIKHGDKVWIVLFTCAVYRAIHLELVSSLSTDAFLLSLRRFIARRGRPRTIYSDNGTNFRGASNALKDINWSRVISEAQIQRINWKFNPPTAAWWGGWWERLVRVVKELLKRTLGRAVLTHEELQTVLCDCESVINSRPLTYLSEDSDDLIPLTPAMLMKESSTSKVSDIDTVDSNHYRKRIRYRTKIMENLRSRFRKEYLSQLVQKRIQGPQSSGLKLGEIVLVGDDAKKRLNWPLAKVLNLIPGKDGKVRTVQLKTQSGVLTRPIQRVYPLEMSSKEIQDPIVQHETSGDASTTAEQSVGIADADQAPDASSSGEPRFSRTGRAIKTPNRLDLFNVTGGFEPSLIDSKGGRMLEKHFSSLTN